MPELTEKLKNALADVAKEVYWSINMPVILIDKSNILKTVVTLKNQLNYDMFLDVTAVDWLDKKPQRFEIVYHFYSTTKFSRVRLKTVCDIDNASVASLKPLFGSAYFMERECHEMYGINFEGNDDLRPILLYEGFVGHPMRKDYKKNKEQPIVPYIDNYSIK